MSGQTRTHETSAVSTRGTFAAWDRPMLWFAIVNAVASIVFIVLAMFDTRDYQGMSFWIKPLKFSLSFVFFATTWSWLIGYLGARARRRSRYFTAVVLVMSTLEMVAITLQAGRGTGSHFNMGTPFDTFIASAMGVGVILIWTGTLLLTTLLWSKPIGDRSITRAIHCGAIVSLIGMAVAVFMVFPTSDQIAGVVDGGELPIIGAHTVGAPDGAPGLFFFGWSLDHGDLRAPHFIGMHALQIIPLFALGLMLLGRRVSPLKSETTRTRLVTIFAVAYLAVVALTTWQALRGQSITSPDAITIGAASAIVGISALAIVAVFISGSRKAS